MFPYNNKMLTKAVCYFNGYFYSCNKREHISKATFCDV